MPNDIREHLTKYLTDAHSIEEQALQQLRKAPDIAGEPGFAAALRQHLGETEGHERRIRDLLSARGASPSRVKDAAMRAGGSGFILFARSQPDTPGKLAAHALSFEALESASYELLALTAERAGDADVADTARQIRGEEQAMMERIEGLLDGTVEASLAGKSPDEVAQQLVRYLADAHAIEEQSIQLLESGIPKLRHTTLARLFREHLDESRQQRRLIEDRLEALGGGPSRLKDAAMRLGGWNWGAFFSAHPDTTGKLAAFAYAFEHLEIGGYEQLRRVAQRAGDEDTVAVADRILAQERDTAQRLAAAFDLAVSTEFMDQAAD